MQVFAFAGARLHLNWMGEEEGRDHGAVFGSGRGRGMPARNEGHRCISWRACGESGWQLGDVISAFGASYGELTCDVLAGVRPLSHQLTAL